MKNMVKLFGVIALVAVIGFSMAACKNDDDGDPEGTINGSSIASGAPVTIPEEAKSQTDFSYLSYEGGGGMIKPLNTIINEPASVKITNGKIDINLGTPKSESLDSISEWAEATGLTINPNDAKTFFGGQRFCTSDGSYLLVCIKGNSGFALLVYADKDVTIKGKATTGNGFIDDYDASLKKGWNYLIMTWIKSTGYKYTSAATLPDGFKWTVMTPEAFSNWFNNAK